MNMTFVICLLMSPDSPTELVRSKCSCCGFLFIAFTLPFVKRTKFTQTNIPKVSIGILKSTITSTRTSIATIGSKMIDQISPSPQRAVLAAHDDKRTSAHEHASHEHASDEHASSSSKPTSINENSKNALAMIHDQMVALAKNKESYPEARDLALGLLMRPDFPLAIRVRAHIILACGKNDYFHHAQEAVRLVENGLEMFGPGSTPRARAAVEGLLRRARESLRRAERDSAEGQRIRAGLKDGSIKKAKGEKIMYGGAYLTVLPYPSAMTTY
jgi:hypothetical protein